MKKIILASAACVFALSACGGKTVKETLGIDNRAPDEFRVVSRPPLSVPPQFDLRPPSAEGVAQPATRDQAQEVVLGTPTASSKTSKAASSSSADSLFLQKAGVANANPNIKQELAEKRISDQLKKEDRSWWESMGTNEKKEPVVKADAEAERIKTNKEQGKPVTEGKTPESGGGEQSTLERWFGW